VGRREGRCLVLVNVGRRVGIRLRGDLVRRMRGVVMPVVLFSDKIATQTEMVMTLLPLRRILVGLLAVAVARG
jgi:hypothetical protein